jgi:hypothetical protein
MFPGLLSHYLAFSYNPIPEHTDNLQGNCKRVYASWSFSNSNIQKNLEVLFFAEEISAQAERLDS